LPEDQAPKHGLWKRILLGAFMIVIAAAGATSVAAFHEVDRVVNAFKQEPELDVGNELSIADTGKPQTILLIGSDVRQIKGTSGYAGGARSDTLILIRLDPSKKATALLSIPRDLKVSIPGHGVAKINEAYSDGGAKLTVKTVKEITGLRINHVISVNFLGFVDAVNRLGCVYMDIDHRYYNSGTGFGSFAAIDLQPGYQRLCGRDALSFVRFRHTDSDIVRAARQQQFLAQMKQQVSVGTLIGLRAKLLKIFGKYTRSDIRSRSAVLRILKLALLSAGHPVQQIPFDGPGIEVGPSFVNATDSQMQKLARQFIGVEPIGTSSSKTIGSNKHKKRKHGRPASSLGLVNIAANGRSMALQTVSGGASFPVYYPTLAKSGDLAVSPPRAYDFVTKQHKHYPAYRMVFKTSGLGQYWGVQGLAGFTSPPNLKGPHEIRHYHGQTFNVYFEGKVTRLVSWKARNAVYWVENSLSGALTESQMITIARTARHL
jgi:polyisoprenyl-teichoic acid--peptidoglycan teichoic acid transferase